MNVKEILKTVDHTLLTQTATWEDIKAILAKRPFKSVQDFCERMVDEDGKKQISKDKVVNLIKAGAFNVIENKSRQANQKIN